MQHMVVQTRRTLTAAVRSRAFNFSRAAGIEPVMALTEQVMGQSEMALRGLRGLRGVAPPSAPSASAGAARGDRVQ